MKVLELIVPGPMVLVFIVMTGAVMGIGAWSENTNMFFISIITMLHLIAVLLGQVVRVLWQIRDRMNGER